MGKRLWILGCALLSCLLLYSCAAPAATVSISSPGAEERVLSDVRTQYRSAKLIVSGVCMGSHIDAAGNPCYDLCVTKVYAGNAAVGDMIHCASSAMNKDANYLLFLKQGQDVNYSEDTAGYALDGAPRPIVDSEVIWDGKRLSLREFQSEIQELSSVVSAPAPVYYYDSLAELAAASNDVFIGRVQSLPQMRDLTFSIRNGGAVEKLQYSASIATIEVYGVMKGALGYGDTLQMVVSPGRVDSMLNAATLTHMEFTAGQTPFLQQGGVYVFFLAQGPDSKQPYYFPVNPVQGYASLTGDTLHICKANVPLQAYAKLPALVDALSQAQNTSVRQATAPALNVNN